MPSRSKKYRHLHLTSSCYLGLIYGVSISWSSPPYNDLHLHIEALRQHDLLVEVDRPIDKDSEMHSLVRWQFYWRHERK